MPRTVKQATSMSNMVAAEEYEHVLAQVREMSGGEEPSFDDAGRLLLRQRDEMTGQVTVHPVPVPRAKPFVRHECLRSSPDALVIDLDRPSDTDYLYPPLVRADTPYASPRAVRVALAKLMKNGIHDPEVTIGIK